MGGDFVKSVLIVSSAEKVTMALTELLASDIYSQITTVFSGSEARRAMEEKEYDLVLINTPLSDEFGDQLGISLTESTLSGVILLVKSEIADGISMKVENAGVFVLAKPINRVMFFHSLKLVASSRQRMLGLKRENTKLQSKLEEIHRVNTAKYRLMERLGMTEQQAHRYIEKQAMDRRLTKTEIAKNILEMYEV